MSLTAALDALVTPAPKQCSVGAWIDAQDPDTRLKIGQVLNAGVSRSRLHAALTGYGFAWSPSALNNHLSGRCACTVTKELIAA